MAKHCGTEHHELVVKPSAIAVLDELVGFFDEPFGDSSAVPTYFVSRLTRQHVTVALSGDGGDESFGGYERYRRILARRNLPRMVRAALGVVGQGIHACLPRRAPGRRYFRSLGMEHGRHFAVGTAELETREILSREFLDSLNGTSTYGLLRPHLETAAPTDRLAGYTSLDVEHYLPDDILAKVDRMSMAHSLEVRSPFLDYRVVELAATFPCDWKMGVNDQKVILKDAFAGDLPADILRQRKQGFSIPLAEWLRGELRNVLQDALHDRAVGTSGMFNMEEVRALAREHLSGNRDRHEFLWNFLFFFTMVGTTESERHSDVPRLKIMHLVHGLPAGGLENGVINLCNRLNPSQFAPSICTLEGGGRLESRVDTGRVELFTVRRFFGNDPSLPLRLAWHLIRRKIDILHTHSWVTLVEGCVAAKLARIGVVVHGEHGFPMEERPRNVRVQHWFWNRISQVTSVCGILADRMEQVVGYPRRRIAVIPNGVDAEHFRPSGKGKLLARSELGLPPDAFLLGTVGRLVPVKNHAGTLRALAALRRIGIDAKLALAGDGPLRDELQRLAVDLNVQANVSFLGELADVAPLLQALDVFVLNSTKEGMSNTILEAMACGVPVVATSVGSNGELVADGQTGYLVPTENDRELTGALERLARKPESLLHFGREARFRVESRFGIDRMVQNYSELYMKLAGKQLNVTGQDSTCLGCGTKSEQNHVGTV